MGRVGVGVASLAVLLCCAPASHLWAAQPPLVLVLNSYHPQYTWTEELVRGVRDELQGIPPENLHIEFMDARRMVDDEQYLDLLAAVYRHKYQRFRPDVIISSDDSALNFLLQRRDALFPGVPVVFCGINSRTPEELERVPNMTGILEGLEVAGNLSLIRRRPLFGASESNISSRVKYWRPFFGQKVGRKRRTVAPSWATLRQATRGTLGAQSG